MKKELIKCKRYAKDKNKPIKEKIHTFLIAYYKFSENIES